MQIEVFPNSMHNLESSVTMHEGSEPVLHYIKQSNHIVKGYSIAIATTTLTFFSAVSTSIALGKTRAVFCLEMDVTSVKLMLVCKEREAEHTLMHVQNKSCDKMFRLYALGHKVH